MSNPVLVHTRLVRSIMRSFGKSMLYTNLYESGTRTVKCYASSRANDRRMVAMIEGALTNMGKKFKIRTTEGDETFRGRYPGAIIVAFPNDAKPAKKWS